MEGGPKQPELTPIYLKHQHCCINTNTVVSDPGKLDIDHMVPLGNARISGKAAVFGKTQVLGNAWVFNDAHVYSEAHICGDARVPGHIAMRLPPTLHVPYSPPTNRSRRLFRVPPRIHPSQLRSVRRSNDREEIDPRQQVSSTSQKGSKWPSLRVEASKPTGGQHRSRAGGHSKSGKSWVLDYKRSKDPSQTPEVRLFYAQEAQHKLERGRYVNFGDWLHRWETLEPCRVFSTNLNDGWK